MDIYLKIYFSQLILFLILSWVEKQQIIFNGGLHGYSSFRTLWLLINILFGVILSFRFIWNL
jgi:hypothetical protein